MGASIYANRIVNEYGQSVAIDDLPIGNDLLPFLVFAGTWAECLNYLLCMTRKERHQLVCYLYQPQFDQAILAENYPIQEAIYANC